MLTLTQFLFRLSFGLCLSMALVSPRQVTCGYFRNNLYVVLGLCVLATLIAFGAAGDVPLDRWNPLLAAMLSYVARSAGCTSVRERASRFCWRLLR